MRDDGTNLKDDMHGFRPGDEDKRNECAGVQGEEFQQRGTMHIEFAKHNCTERAVGKMLDGIIAISMESLHIYIYIYISGGPSGHGRFRSPFLS